MYRQWENCLIHGFVSKQVLQSSSMVPNITMITRKVNPTPQPIWKLDLFEQFISSFSITLSLMQNLESSKLADRHPCPWVVDLLITTRPISFLDEAPSHRVVSQMRPCIPVLFTILIWLFIRAFMPFGWPRSLLSFDPSFLVASLLHWLRSF